jgi:hypothetical protein
VGIEALAALVAKAVVPVLVSRLAGVALPEETLTRWLGRDPPRLALQSALREALAAFQARFPRESQSFFDEVFLGSRPVADLLARCIPPGPPPDPAELARLYVDHLGPARDRDAAIGTAMPACAAFLEVFREHLRHKPPFRPLFDSAAGDATAAAVAAIAAQVAALPDIFARLERAPARLKLHIKPATTVREQRTEHFVGREWVFAALDDRLLDPTLPSGYIVIRAEPGYGKSALMAELVRRRDYVHHFNVVTSGIRTAEQFLRNVCAQLIQRYELPYPELPADAGQDGAFLDVLLHDSVAAAEATGELPVVVVVDALDEAQEPADASAGVNRLCLPEALPDYVYVVATIRTGVDELLWVKRRAEPLVLDETDARNLADLREYVEEFLDRRSDVMATRVTDWAPDAEAFIREIVDRSEGNFMYVVSVLDGIAAEKNPLTPATFGGAERLPSGLEDYYERHWRAMRDRDRDLFERYQRPVVCMLATAPGPVDAALVAEWVNGSGRFAAVEERDVERVFEEWRQFLNEEPAQEPGEASRWRIYHASFLAFLARTVDLGVFRRAAVEATKAKVRWDA